MRFVHLYPFAPRGRDGGTLRLLGALEASEGVGETELHWFDPREGRWRGPWGIDDARRAVAEPVAGRVAPASVKRRLFPSTLWEAGRRPRAALGAHRSRLGLGPGAALFLHTSYLAPLTASLAGERVPALVDVYDLVWRAHANDARQAGGAMGLLRSAYSRSVRAREQPALARASTAVVAGYEDCSLLRATVPEASWIPTPTPVRHVPMSEAGETLAVGMIGNFEHISTRQSAERVLASPLARDPAVRLVFAGRGSRGAVSPGPGVEVLGELREAEDFYARVQCVVAPVTGGSGIKCKLGEALLAGRGVITTELGAAGYPPELRRHLAVCDPAAIDASTVRRAGAELAGEAALETATRMLGSPAVAAAYARALEPLRA